MTKRLAIQIFGHLRTFEHTYSSFYDNVIKPNLDNGWTIDVFAHVWDEIEYSAPQWHNEKAPQMRGKKLTAEQIDFFKKHYNPVVMEITPQLQTDDDTKYPEFTGGYTAYKTMINVWFTKYRVNQLRQQYERKKHIKYDYVLNTRADILYQKPFVMDDILKPYTTLLHNWDKPTRKLFFGGVFRDLPVHEPDLLAASDIFYFGTPSVMNAVSSIYSHLNHHELREHFMSWEQYLIYTAKKHNITPIRIEYSPNVEWRILRLFEAEKQPKKFKFISLHIRKNYIRFVFCNILIKLCWGMYHDN